MAEETSDQPEPAARKPIWLMAATLTLVLVAMLVVGGLVGTSTRSNGAGGPAEPSSTLASEEGQPIEIVDPTIPTTVAAGPVTDDGAPRTFYVSPEASDDATGVLDDPFRSLEDAFETLEPGDTLFVREGVFREDVKPSIRPGQVEAPITVEAFPGERPVIEGLLWLREPSYWRIRGINVTWSDDNSRRDHMVKFSDGQNWEFTDAEVWGAESYAAILVAGEPENFLLARLFVRDTYEANDDNQDHLIYLNSGTGGGVVEHCLLVRSENGRGIKIGGTSRNAEVSNVVIRFNTFFDNLGPSSVQLSYGASDNRIERNIFVRPGGDGFAVTSFRLSGTGNVVSDNIAWEATSVIQTDVDGLVDGGGNLLFDPGFVDPDADDFRVLSPEAQGYGQGGAEG